MNNYLTKNYLGFENAASKNWCISTIYQKHPCKAKVEFEDGKSALYRSVNNVEKGDVAVIGNGCKTSYAMGKVIDNTNTSGGKTKLSALPFVFTDSADVDIIKRAAQKMSEASLKTTQIAYSEKTESYCFDITEADIRGILYAISILAFKDYATAAQIKKATAFLETPKKFNTELFEQEVFLLDFMKWTIGSVRLSGFYEGWSEKFQNLAVWGKTKSAGCETSYRQADDCDALDIYNDNASDSLKEILEGDEELNMTYSEHCFRSALSIIIRGGFTNLLEAALSVNTPVKFFYGELCALAEEIGSVYCLEILKANEGKISNQKPPAFSKAKNPEADGIPKEFSVRNKVLIMYKGKDEKVVIPDGVKAIGEIAFSGQNIKEVVIPDSVTKIGCRAFSECKKLEKVTFGKNLKEIGYFAFENTSQLKSVDLSNTNMTVLGVNAFRYATSLKEIILPDSLEEIHNDALANTAVSEIVVPKSIKYVNAEIYRTCKVRRINGSPADKKTQGI